MNEVKIAIGEYIRTNRGDIGYVAKIEGSFIYDKENRLLGFTENVIKISTEIIDLIREGDYVNGEKITEITKDLFIKNQINLWTGIYELNSFGDRSVKKITNNDIKSIVTKEQFEQMKYIVEENK